MLAYLILAYPYAPPGYRGFASRRDIVSVSLREGIDTLDELAAEFGDFYILETSEPDITALCECGHPRHAHQTGEGPATGWCFAYRGEQGTCDCEAFT